MHSEKQFPKSKYIVSESGQVSQLLLLSVGPVLHVLQLG